MEKRKMYALFILCLPLLTMCIAQNTSTLKGTIAGKIGMYEGNCMPGPGIPPCEPKPISTKVYFTRPSNSFEQTYVVDSIVTTPEGDYQIELEAGTYSVFLQDGEEIVCTGMQCPSDCFCTLIQVNEGETIELNLNIDHASW